MQKAPTHIKYGNLANNLGNIGNGGSDTTPDNLRMQLAKELARVDTEYADELRDTPITEPGQVVNGVYLPTSGLKQLANALRRREGEQMMNQRDERTGKLIEMFLK